MAEGKSIHITPKEFRAVAVSVASAADCIGTLAPGCRIVGLTKGQFSLLDLLRAVVEQTGPADVVISTWTTGIRDAEMAAWLVETGLIRSLSFLTDRSFPARQPAYCKRLVELFGPDAIVCTRVHAKIALVRNESWNIAIRSSMNLNRNPRFEQFDLDDDPALAAWLAEQLFDDVAARMPAGTEHPTARVDAAFVAALGGGCALPLDAPEEDEVDAMVRRIRERR